MKYRESIKSASVLLIVFLFNSCLISVYSQQQSNCLFNGCTCEGDGIQEGGEAGADDYGDSGGSTSVNNNEPYVVVCNNVDSFPERDNKRRHSNLISTFEIIDRGITEIPAGHLSGLEIELADFGKNKIDKISPNAFEGVVKLEALYLNHNNIEKIEPDTFVPISSTLGQLKLNHNKLGHMSQAELSAALAPLKNLNVLVLSHNHLERIPDLKSFKDLLELSLDGNFISSLNDESDTQLLPSSLVELSLKENRLTQLNENSFANLKNLKYLNLESNQINFINENTFKHLKTLTNLNLCKNYINHIPSGIFHSLVNLERLDLSSQNQMLRQIDNYAFDRHPNSHPIRKVDLSNNRIAKIDDKAFCSRSAASPYVFIREIDLAANSLTGLNACIVRQLAKGLNEYSAMKNQSHRAKISFKPNQANQMVTDSLKCDCEVTKSAHLVDFEGDCKTSEGVSVPLKQYQCSMITSLTRSTDEIEKECLAQSRFDCADQLAASASSSSDEPHQERQPTDSKKPNQHHHHNQQTEHQQPDSGGASISPINEQNKQPNKERNNNQATKQPSAVSSNANRFNQSSLFVLIATIIVSTTIVKSSLISSPSS